MASSSSLIFLSPKSLLLLSHSKRPPFSKTTYSSYLHLHSSKISPLLSVQFINTKKSRSSLSSSSSSRFASISSESDQEYEDDDDDVLSNQKQQQVDSPDQLKLFVGNLPFNVTSATLAALFGRTGNVDQVEVIYDKLSGKSRGFAFVTMSSVDEVEAAEQQFNGYELEGRPLRVNSGPPPPKEDGFSRSPRGGGESSSYGSRGRGGGESSYGSRGRGGGESSYGGESSRGSFDSSNKLYIGNLSWGVDDMALETLFGQKGKVMEAKVVYDRETGRSRGFGFVTYSSADELNSAIDSLDGADLDGRSIRVTVAESKPRRSF